LKVKDHTQQPQGLGHAGSVPAIPRRSACHTGPEVLGGKSINAVVGIRDNRCTLHRASPCESDDNLHEVRRTTIVDTQSDAAAAQ
jgi:hypothetical protein